MSDSDSRPYGDDDQRDEKLREAIWEYSTGDGSKKDGETEAEKKLREEVLAAKTLLDNDLREPDSPDSVVVIKSELEAAVCEYCKRFIEKMEKALKLQFRTHNPLPELRDKPTMLFKALEREVWILVYGQSFGHETARYNQDSLKREDDLRMPLPLRRFFVWMQQNVEMALAGAEVFFGYDQPISAAHLVSAGLSGKDAFYNRLVQSKEFDELILQATDPNEWRKIDERFEEELRRMVVLPGTSTGSNQEDRIVLTEDEAKSLGLSELGTRRQLTLVSHPPHQAYAAENHVEKSTMKALEEVEKLRDLFDSSGPRETRKRARGSKQRDEPDGSSTGGGEEQQKQQQLGRRQKRNAERIPVEDLPL